MTRLDDSIFDDGYESSSHHQVQDRPAPVEEEWDSPERESSAPAPMTRAERRRALDAHPERGSRRERGRPPRRPRGVSCLVLVLAGALVAAAVWFAVGALGPLGSLVPGFEDNDYPGPGSGSVEVTIESGASGAVIGQTLQEAGVVKTTSSFTAVATAQPERAAQIQPGTYTMLREMAAVDAFDRLLSSESKVAQGTTLPEGLWRSEIYVRLSEATGVPVEDYTSAEESADLELPDEAGGSIEGWLFPSTYEFADDASAVDQLNTMIGETVGELEDAGVPREEWERTLTVASIVEGESGAADRAKVARVIENRLEDTTGPTVGMLQMDSTIHYMLQKRGTITTSDKERNIDSPYNTYKNKGLPPGPINNPGAAGIEAAGNPDDGDWLFFVTVDPDTGETKFAETQAEHDANVQEFCRNTGSCE